MSGRTGFDSTTVADIPARAQLVALYVDGRFRTIDAGRRRFPNARIAAITVTGAHNLGATVVDQERGDLTPEQAATWAAREVGAGRRPTIYTERSTWATCINAVHAAGLDPTHVAWWIADYTGHPHVPDPIGNVHATACQYADPRTSGGHYDLTFVPGFWPGVDPLPGMPRRWRVAGAVLARYLERRPTPLREGPARRTLVRVRAAVDRVLAL